MLSRAVTVEQTAWYAVKRDRRRKDCLDCEGYSAFSPCQSVLQSGTLASLCICEFLVGGWVRGEKENKKKRAKSKSHRGVREGRVEVLNCVQYPMFKFRKHTYSPSIAYVVTRINLRAKSLWREGNRWGTERTSKDQESPFGSRCFSSLFVSSFLPRRLYHHRPWGMIGFLCFSLFQGWRGVLPQRERNDQGS